MSYLPVGLTLSLFLSFLTLVGSSANAQVIEWNGRTVERFPNGAGTPVGTEKVTPRYPRLASGADREGAVIMNYLVEMDGSVTESEITWSYPETLFNEAAKTAILKWQFPEPEGELPELRSVMFTFLMEGEPGADVRYVRRLERARKDIFENGDLESARERLDSFVDLFERGTLNLYEVAAVKQTEAIYSIAAGDFERAIEEGEIADFFARNMDDANHALIFRILAMAYLRTARYVEAVRAYDELKALGQTTEGDSLGDTIEAVREALDRGRPISAN